MSKNKAKRKKRSMFPSWPYFAPDEIDAVRAVLRSGKVNYWTGEQGRLFEKEFAGLAGTRYAIALANGTVALELALHALGIGPGDEVIVASRTFIASASCIVMRGALPIMADIDRVSQNITVDTIRSVITPKTRAIIAVHLAGWPCDMDEIMSLANDHDISVIEDCAQAHGATYSGRSVGSLGHVAAFSFCQDKIITTGGEGGMLTTNDKRIWEKAWSFKDHGKSYDAVFNGKQPYGFRWLHESFGTNWRMTEMQSAIGRAQLKKLPKWLDIRRRHAALLSESFKDMDEIRVTEPPNQINHAYYKYYAFIRPEMIRKGWNRDRIIDSINNEGIPCFSGSCSEIYLEKAFLKNELQPKNRLPVAQELGETSLMFLVHPTLKKNDILRIIEAVKRIINRARK